MNEMARLASSRAPGSICTIATGAFGYGNARVATWLPPTTANQVPSAIWSTATCAAYLAASMFGPLIDPEVSMMTISATPPLLVAAVPAPELVTVTIACTSVAPSERNSFWNTSVRKSATVAPRSGCGRCRVGRDGLVGVDSIDGCCDAGQRRGDVVVPALAVGPADQLGGDGVGGGPHCHHGAVQEVRDV